MIYNKGVNDMNVTLILYESRYTIGEKVAKMISPILGPAKAFNIEYPPENIKYYSNIVFVFSLYGHDSSKKTIDYIEKNKNMVSDDIAELLKYLRTGKVKENSCDLVKNIQEKFGVIKLSVD